MKLTFLGATGTVTGSRYLLSSQGENILVDCVYCSEATHDLCEILLPDSGRLLEEEANFANRHGMGQAGHAPKRTFITHGEPDAADAPRKLIDEQLGWDCRVPEHLESVELA